MSTTPASRLADLDHLRTFLTALVICHHSAIAFGAAGGWYYVVPPPKGSLAPLLLTMFTGVNQAFFMALFFGIAGYFTPAAFAGKGSRAFLRDRLSRLGIPLLVYFLLLNPVVVYLARRFQGQASEGFGAFVADGVPRIFGTGPLWFVLALLLFSIAYAGWRSSRQGPDASHPFPGDGRILRGAGGGAPGSAAYDRIMHPTAHRLLAKCDGVLRPLRGASGYNHFSVRSAAAIMLDRILGDWH